MALGFPQKLTPLIMALGVMLVVVVVIVVPGLISDAARASQPISRTIKQKTQQCEGCRLELTPDAFRVGESAEAVDRRLRNEGFYLSDGEGTYVRRKADDVGFGCDRDYFVHVEFDQDNRQLISASGIVSDTCF